MARSRGTSPPVQEKFLMAIYALFIGSAVTSLAVVGLYTFRPDLDDLAYTDTVGRTEWYRTSGLIMIGVATLLLALSLIRWDQTLVISNGLLLGGLFTMIFGIGLSMNAGDDVGTFLVLTLALAIMLGLGYLRFATRSKAPGASPAPDGSPSARGLPGQPGPTDAELAARVDSIEDRMRRLGEALGDETLPRRQ